MSMVLSVQYSNMISLILNTIFSFTRDFHEEIQQKCKLLRLYSQFSFTKNINSTTVLYIYNILEERPKALLKVFLIDVDGVTLPRHTQDYFNYYHLWLLFQRFFFNKREHLVFSNLKKPLVYLFDFKFD